jgi:hydroxypyruvate isomerase
MTNPIQRRNFLASTALAATALTATGSIANVFGQESASGESTKFKLRYAPHPGMFKASAGDDVLDQIRFAFDQGFTAWEDNGMPGRTVAEQEAIGKLLDSLGMEMGVFVAYGSFDEPVFVRPGHGKRDEFLGKLKEAVDVAKRCGATWVTVVPGSVDQQHKDDEWNRYGGPRSREGRQAVAAIELLKRGAEILEPHGLVMVLEPLNWEVNHGGVFLRSTDQAYLLCKAVDSPACKILYDVYHEQITAGNILNTMDECWDEIAYIQTGDNPGRKEPGTGEMNYRNIFKHLAAKSTDMVIGMEHGNSMRGQAGEQAVIDAYRTADDF